MTRNHPGSETALGLSHWLRRGVRFGAAAAGAGLAGLLLAPVSPSVGAETPAAPFALAVSAAKAKNECFTDTVEVLGTVAPRREILVRPDREGLQIREISAEPGDTVTASQALARLAAPSEPENAAGTTITAPAAGIVLSAPTVRGEMATAKGAPLFRIVADGDMDLTADVPAKQASRLALGQPAKVKVAGMDEAHGKVRLVSSTIDPNTQLGQVAVALERNPLHRVGAFARAVIDVGKSCGVAVPQSALLFGPDGAVVQVIRDNRVETHRVAVGLFSSNTVQVREGLSEGDMIVVRAGAFLRDGDRVRPITANE